MNAADLITDEQAATFWRDGASCLRGLFSAEWVERMRAAVDEALAHPGPIALDVAKTDRPEDRRRKRFYVELSAWPTRPAFNAFVYESPAIEIAARLLGSDKVNLFFDQLFVKEPGTVETTPWHQDRPYWPVEGDQILSVWLALDPTTLENGGLEYIRGSHRWKKFYRPEPFGHVGETAERALKTLEGETMPDYGARRKEFEFLNWDMEPGDCLTHHAMTIHGAPGNRAAATRRRAYSTRWTGDDATWNPRPGILEKIPPPTLAEIPLKKGDPLDCDAFPRLWPRPAAAPKTSDDSVNPHVAAWREQWSR